jgi:hypothetical protein
LITIYTNHKDLTFLNFTTNHITCWQLIVEEYGPNIVYLPSKHNIIANNLSCLPKLNEPHDESIFLEEFFALNEQLDAFPIAFDVISKAQLANNKIQKCITMTQTSKQEYPTSTIGILQRKNCNPCQPFFPLTHLVLQLNPCQPFFPLTHLVSQKPTSFRHQQNVSNHLTTFHLAQPTHTN